MEENPGDGVTQVKKQNLTSHAHGNGRVNALRYRKFTILDPGLTDLDSDFS